MIFPGATWVPGAPNKRYLATNACRGAVAHSAEGYEAGLRSLIANPYSQSSWHFSVLNTGEVLQHYDTLASCWASGCYAANTTLVAIEHEGRAGEALKLPQMARSKQLIEWLSAVHGFPLIRGAGLYEHNEVVQWSTPNSGPTACPSGRIPWAQMFPPGGGGGQAEVQTRPLNPDQTYQLIEAFGREFSDVSLDQNGLDALEITEGFPIPAGKRRFVVTLSASNTQTI